LALPYLLLIHPEQTKHSHSAANHFMPILYQKAQKKKTKKSRRLVVYVTATSPAGIWNTALVACVSPLQQYHLRWDSAMKCHDVLELLVLE